MAKGLLRPQLAMVLLALALLLPATVTEYYPVEGIMSVESRAHESPYHFPNGGRTLFPAYKLVALYGAPGAPELGALGEQDAQASIDRVKQLAAAYQPHLTQHILPTLEIIATVASDSPVDGSYSYPIPMTKLASWEASALKEGVYVVLDLQPGRSSFLDQAQAFAGLLSEPNVGLALDPEWRLAPNQLPLVQIGSVSINEVNQTAQWLAALTAKHKLPQKLFLLHQFLSGMIQNRQQLDTSHKELAYTIQMDGQGSQAAKLDTWQSITADPPAGVRFGWKNFYKKDASLRSPEDTARLSPEPWYISYQ